MKTINFNAFWAMKIIPASGRESAVVKEHQLSEVVLEGLLCRVGLEVGGGARMCERLSVW